jgi:BASS family bile acid:Na+ symporter
MLLALEVGLALGTGDLRRQLHNPVLGRTLLVGLLGVPMLAILVAVTLPLGPVARGALVLLSVAPGAPILMHKAQASGNVALAAALAIALTLAALVFVPVELFVLNRLFRSQFVSSIPALLDNLVPKLILPLALGATMRRRWPKAARAIDPLVRALFRIALVVAVVGALAVSWREVLRMTPWAWLAMLLVTLGAAWLGDAFGGRDPRDRATAAYAVVLGNPAIAMSVATVSYPALHAVPIIVAYALLRAVFVLPYAVIAQRRLATGRN